MITQKQKKENITAPICKTGLSLEHAVRKTTISLKERERDKIKYVHSKTHILNGEKQKYKMC